MRAVVQRTEQAAVKAADGQEFARIGKGLTVLLGVGQGDSEADANYLADKIVNLRIFSDADDKMNLSVKDINGELLVVSQFTLYGDCRKGRRPSFALAAAPQEAINLYESFLQHCQEAGVQVACGRFQTEMTVQIDNHGPVTILLDSKRDF